MSFRHILHLTLAMFLLCSATANAEEAYPVKLRPGEAGSKLAPRYSPKGFKIALTPMGESDLEGRDHLHGRMQLGPKTTRGAGRLLVLARSAESKPFNLLWIDTDGDGAVADENLLRVTPSTRRSSTYTSFTIALHINHGSHEEPAWEPYPINLWVAVETESRTPAFIRFSRRGFLVGAVAIGETTVSVLLSDADNDAVLGEGDWWALIPSDADQANNISGSRKVGDFAWAGERAYKLELDGTAGRRGRVVPFDPGLTRGEDVRKRDPLWDDKQEERAASPLIFVHDVDEAIEGARATKTPYFLDFETTWCMPCKQMDRWVYTAKKVVAAADGVTCVKVDGDERKDLKALHEVTGFPTGILFGSNGEEIARFTGYQTVAGMVAFFAKAAAFLAKAARK